MTAISLDTPAAVSAAYAALRYGGAPPESAQIQLDLATSAAGRLERLFRARAARGADAQRPRFARHAAHVAAVTEAGGYPVLAARSR